MIVGDFRDGDRCRFDQFVRSPWQGLFPMLKARKTIYLYGNHDPQEETDERVDLFSVRQCHSLDIRLNGLEFHVRHGQELPASESTLLKLISQIGPSDRFLNDLAGLAIRVFGRTAILLKQAGSNRLMKEWGRRNLPEGTILICGHTHLAELDLAAGFANCGFIGYGYAQYLKIWDGRIALIQERY